MKKPIIKIFIGIACFLNIFLTVIDSYDFTLRKWYSTEFFSPLKYYGVKDNDPPLYYKRIFENPKAWISKSGLEIGPDNYILDIYALSCLSKDLKVIYEIQGLKHELLYNNDLKSPLRCYHFLSYDNRDVYYYFDYENEKMPRVYENIYGSIDFIRRHDFEDGYKDYKDYRYQFITSAKASESVTKETYDLLHTYWMNKDEVDQAFQTKGLLVKQYSYDGKDYEIYGYLGTETSVFTIFNEDSLIACEYLNLNHYSE